MFQPHGDIESLRLFNQKDGKTAHAFVCFKTPDAAQSVKGQGIQVNGKPLYINHYEMKQQRDVVNEANKDKQDWQRYQTENMSNVEFQDLNQISSLLRLLMHQMRGNQQMPSMPNVGGQRTGPHGQMGGHQGQQQYQGNRGPHQQQNRYNNDRNRNAG